jgi:uncharacterized membrane-anchored protein YitT (DUF2179 family)
MKIEPVICSILYSFITTQTSMRIRSDKHKALKYEIITSDATELCGKISDTLHQTATVVNAKGAYSGTDRKMVVCVTKKKNAPFIEDIILQYPAAIVFKSDVDNEIIGIDYK